MRIFVVIAICLGLACTKKEAEAPADPAAEANAGTSEGAAEGTPTVESEEPATPAELPDELKGDTPDLNAAPTVTVTKAGDEPRTALRWTIEPGTTQTAVLNVDFSIEAVVMLLAVKAAPYTVSYDLGMSIGKPASNGATPIALTVNDAKFDETAVTGKQKDQIKAAAAAVRKATGSYEIDARGRITNLSLDMKPGSAKRLRDVPGSTRIAKDLLDNLRWALGQLTPVLPEEPVGAGAEWKVHQAVSQGDLIVNQLSQYRIDEADDGKLEFAVGVDQSAEPQELNRLSAGTSLKLVSFMGEGGGTLAWEPSRLLPRVAEVDLAVIKGVVQSHPEKGSADVAAKSMRAVKIEAP